MAKFRLTIAENRKRSIEVFKRLKGEYPDATCSLRFKTPFELLVATILAAQCTDVQVNKVTKTLFKKFKAPTDYLVAPKGDIENVIRSCGFFRQKSKSIINTCRTLIDHFNGEIPETMDELLKLDGVGRKTANVLRGQWFGHPAIIVDTHCTRLSRRLGFTKSIDATKIEMDLMKIWPEESWTNFSNCMVFHGRAVCNARSPKCSSCVVFGQCPYPLTREGKKIAK